MWLVCYRGPNIILLPCVYPVVPTPLAEQTNLFPLNYLGSFVENQLTINLSVYFWALTSIPLIYMSLLTQSHTLLYYRWFTESLEIGKLCPLTLLFFFKIAFTNLGHLSFNIPFRNSYSISAKKKKRRKRKKKNLNLVRIELDL